MTAEAWRETVIADIRADDGIVTIDTRRHHCGNCEYCDNTDGYCGVFDEYLEPEKEPDGHHLDWRRCVQCITAEFD